MITDESGIEQRLFHHRRWILLVLVVISVLLHTVYFIEINRSPCVWLHQWSQTDMNFFDHWAGQIAGGDLLTNQSLHPYHLSHQFVALEYVRNHPDQFAVFSQDDLETAGRVLWSRWYGGKSFHQEPAYPYLVALTYKLFNHDVRWVFLWQALLGVGSNVLIYLVGRRLFGQVVGVVAGGLAVFCGSLLFYSMVLLRANLITFAGLLLVYLVIMAMESNRLRTWFVAGLAHGVGFLIKSTFVPLFIGVLALMAWRDRRRPRQLAMVAIVFVVGVVAALMPAIARNLAVEVAPLRFSSGAAIQIILGNADYFVPLKGNYIDPPTIMRILAFSEGRPWPTLVQTLKGHESIGSFLGQMWAKWTMVWHWYEFPNNTNFYYYQMFSKVLAALPITHLVIAPLSMVGLALAMPRLWRSWSDPIGVLYLLIVSHIMIVLIASVLGRYRIALVAALIPFAALAIVRLVEWFYRKQWGPASVATIALVVVGLWTARPLPNDIELIRPADYLSLLDWYEDQGPQAAREYLLRVQATEPTNVGIRQTINFRLGELEFQAGQYHDAAKFYERVLSLRPDDGFHESTYINLITTYMKIGALGKGAELAVRAEQQFPESEKIYHNVRELRKRIGIR